MKFNQTLTIKKMTEPDVDKVYNLESELFGTADKNVILETLKNENIDYYLLEFNKEIVGFFEALIISPEAELYDIAVLEKYRRRGFAKYMLAYFEEIAKFKGCNTLLLEVNIINKPAISLYLDFGFIKYNTRKNYYGKNDAILLKKLI